jgi:hypothetical protein
MKHVYKSKTRKQDGGRSNGNVRPDELFVCTVWSFDTRGLFLFLYGALSLFHFFCILMFMVYAFMHLLLHLSISYPFRH